ncbi:MAG: hypothetical protein AAGA64_13060 [Bacteroidota bacterium]
MKKISFVIFLGVIVNSTIAQNTIEVLNDQEEHIEFFLTGTNNTLLESNADGIVKLTIEQLMELRNETFTFHFTNHLAYLLYRTRLFHEPENETRNKFIKHDKITLKKLVADSDGKFYLRRKVNNVDD